MRLTTLKPTVGTLRTGPAVLSASPAGAWRADKRTANARGYNYKWQQASKGYLAKHPLCECQDCQAGAKRVTMATVVNHRLPHRGNMSSTDPNGFWNRSNWESMSKTCHDKRTQDELRPGWAPPPRLKLDQGDDGLIPG